jgi:hypothetical protein
VVGTSAAAGILAELCLRHPHVAHGAIFHEPVFPSGVPKIGAVNAARKARVEERMARGGPRAAMELYLRSVAAAARTAARQRRGPVRYRDGSLPRLRAHTRPARSYTSAPPGEWRRAVISSGIRKLLLAGGLNVLYLIHGLAQPG